MSEFEKGRFAQPFTEDFPFAPFSGDLSRNARELAKLVHAVPRVYREAWNLGLLNLRIR